MTWFRFDAATPEHPKVKKLARVLKVPRVLALGHLSMLWARTCAMAPSGDLGSFDAEDVASMAEWEDEAEAFVEALVKVRLLDELEGGGFAVHDWLDRAEAYKRAQAEKDRRDRRRRDAAKKTADADPGRQPVDASSALGAEEKPDQRAPQLGTRGARVGHGAPRLGTRAPDGQDGQDRTDGQTGQDVGGDETPTRADGRSGDLFPPPAPPEPAPPVLEFPASGRKGGKQRATYALTEEVFAEMQAGFPTLDVEGTLTEALRKVKVQAVKMPTAKGYPQFLWNWLKREANSTSSPFLLVDRHAGAPRGSPRGRTTVVDRLEQKAREAEERARGAGDELHEVRPGEYAPGRCS